MASNFLAQGNINPCTLVKADTSNDFSVLACGAGDIVRGVAQDGTRQPPGVTGSDGYAAHAGESIQVFQDGDECLVLLGGTVAVDDFIKADASAQGVKADLGTPGTYHVAGRMLEAGVSGEKRRMKVLCAVITV